MRLALLQVAYDDALDPAEHRRRVTDRVREAGRDADLVMLPELWSAGAFTPKRWAERAEPLDGPTVTALADAARDAGCVVHVGAIVEAAAEGAVTAGSSADGSGPLLHNTAVVLGPDGDRIAAYRKIHTFGAGGMEGELMRPGTEECVAEVPLRDGGSVRVGLATCYDVRFPELFRLLLRREPALLLVTASWPTARERAWSALLTARAIENQAFVAACGAAGVSGRTPMAGASVVLSPDGEVVAEAPHAAHHPGGAERGAPDAVVTCEIDVEDAAAARRDFPVLGDRRLSRV